MLNHRCQPISIKLYIRSGVPSFDPEPSGHRDWVGKQTSSVLLYVLGELSGRLLTSLPPTPPRHNMTYSCDFLGHSGVRHQRRDESATTVNSRERETILSIDFFFKFCSNLTKHDNK